VISVLKGIGYLIAAVAVLTVLLSAGALIVAVGLAVGLLVSVVSMVLFTASGLRSFFGKPPAKD
jgi:hypothetical protein